MARLFGTDGVRGVVGSELTPELALRLGRAIGVVFGKGSRILLGRDVRAGGDLLAKAVASGLQAEMVKVYNAGLLPTPALQYMVKSEGFDGGVMITASHNPPEYNGIKVVDSDGIEISREKERVIEEHYFKGTASVTEWRALVASEALHTGALERYIEAIIQHVDPQVIAKRGFKVVVDCANSVGALVTPKLLSLLKAKPITINCDLNPEFPGREPEPTPDSLRLASLLVRESGADLGVGHDGDADRSIIIDERGEAHWGDRTGALLTAFAGELDKSLPRVTYTGVSSSMLVEEFLGPRGIRVEWTPVGSVVISRMIKERGGAISGFEENGGYMHVPHQIVRDGAMTLALTLYMLASWRENASSLYSKLPKYHAIKTKVRATRQEALCAVEEVRRHFRGYRLIEIDGVKVVGEDFWILVRPSGTEPVLRIMVEGKTRERAETALQEAKNAALRCISG